MLDIFKMMNESAREKSIHKQAEKLRLELVTKCKRCGGSGRRQTPFLNKETLSFRTYPCSCFRKFKIYYNMLVSGYDIGFLDKLLTTPVQEVKVCEIDISNAKSNVMKGTFLFKDHLNKYVKDVSHVIEKGYSYLFTGANSTGKTFSASWVARKFLTYGKTVHYLHFRELMKWANRSITSKGDERIFSERYFEEIKTVDLLIVDELGKETGNMQHISGEFENIIKERDMFNKPCILITNEEYDNLIARYSSNKSDFSSAFTTSYRVFMFDPRNDLRRINRKVWVY